MRDRKDVYLDERGDGEELGRVEEEETVIRICYVRKKAIFNKRVLKDGPFSFLLSFDTFFLGDPITQASARRCLLVTTINTDTQRKKNIGNVYTYKHSRCQNSYRQ